MAGISLTIIGCGGHAKVVADIAARAGHTIAAYVEVHPREPEFAGRPLISEAELIRQGGAPALVIAIGENITRADAAGRLIEHIPAATFPALIDPSAIVSPSAQLGDGTVIMPGAIVNAGARLDNFCVVNSGAIVEHDVTLGSFASAAPGAIVCGDCKVGEQTYIGAGATIIHGIAVGMHALIGAGAVVVGPVPNHAVMMGAPARRMRNRTDREKML